MAKKGGSMLTIVILNYNGWEDTIACLESLMRQSYTDYRVVVADNGSSDNSASHIIEWATLHQPSHIVLEEGKLAESEKWLTILRLSQNYGFAKGNNLAIKAMHQLPADYWMCLNNDTEMASDCLELLIEYAKNHKDVSVLTPAIRLYSRPEIMWNAGGKLTFGGRRYYCCMRPAASLSNKTTIDITFVTGCALLVRADILQGYSLFTEKFFFGEEDFDFSLKMSSEGRRMVCLLSALVYHKVSASMKQYMSYNKLFIHTLNRMINLREHYPNWQYKLWRSLFVPYIRIRFLRGLSMSERNTFTRLLRCEAKKQDGVSRELFEYYLNYSFHDKK